MPRSTWVRFCAIVHLSNFYENGHPCCCDWCSPWYCLPASLLVPYNGTEESVSKQKEDSTQPPTLKIINLIEMGSNNCKNIVGNKMQSMIIKCIMNGSLSDAEKNLFHLLKNQYSE